MNYHFFVTGFPGFIAGNLINQLIKDYKPSIDKISLLVLPNQEKKALQEISYFCLENRIEESSFEVIVGDITKEDLGINFDKNNELQWKITHIFHLAAIYDLAVEKDLAFQVNVKGTENVTKWAHTIKALQRYVYFSTAYVSGKREGRIFEKELMEGQAFKNYYEQTKYDAEVMVENEKEVLPITIIRPGIVRGHSETGKTIKFDGIYFMLNLLDHLRFSPTIPYIGHGDAEGNFVPVDYVLKATSYLSLATIGTGKTYHLTDPKPYTMRELQKMLSETYLTKTPRGVLPLQLARFGLSITMIRKWLRVEKEAMDYFTTYSSYDCSQTLADLKSTTIRCPDFKMSLESMITYYRKYKDDAEKHINIK
ncbi:SDR family oxidoreductase [Virgibacillus halodenitrificans]|uniref:SDR family oxidoreductase n=1 Tax=Virgibacillus halodenitrificans TaxID=1482 RepID=UPI0024BF8553|nr:SDR family oxidoreductase [Virgibacillus halodenitrificans]WHX24820.1 SDR family oxidoreductase [Virgibacillus halodenitrificans]